MRWLIDSIYIAVIFVTFLVIGVVALIVTSPWIFLAWVLGDDAQDKERQ